jgi:hypothetical protein
MSKRNFPSRYKIAGAASGLLASLMLLTGCDQPNQNPDPNEGVDNPSILGGIPAVGGPLVGGPGVGIIDVPTAIPVPVPAWDFIQLMVKLDPLEPYNERFLDDWRFQLQNIDDQGRPLGPAFFGESGPDGTAAVGLPQYMFQLPLVINAYNDSYPLLDAKPNRRALENTPDSALADNGDIINRCHYGRCDGFASGHPCRRDHHHDRDHDHDHGDNGGCDGGCGGHHDHGDGDWNHNHDSSAELPGINAEGAALASVSTEASANNGDEIGVACSSCGKHHDRDHDDKKKKKNKFECRSFEIFVPPNCYNAGPWLLGPLENAVWNYYEGANRLRGEAWNASQVDCGTWLANLQLLIQTSRVNEELHQIAEDGNTLFDPQVLVETFQENQNFLTPTRPPICMAARFHEGGGLNEGFVLEQDDFPYVIAAGFTPFEGVENADVVGPELIVVNEDGSIRNLCGQRFDAELRVNGAEFEPTRFFVLQNDGDFMGSVHKEDDIVRDLNVRLFNIRLGNGRPLDSDVYDEACALTQLIEFTNVSDEPQNILDNTGVTFYDLFEQHHRDTNVWLTSDGDAVINDDDTWAILYSGDEHCRERVLAIELIGIRAGDFRDTLYMERRDNSGIAENDGEDLFIGLRADARLEAETIDGEYGFMAYTISYWDGHDEEGLKNVRTQISSCYEAADVWARQFFTTSDFQRRAGEDCCLDECCKIEKTICPLRAAEMAVRSQCFSNSRSNNRWQTQEVGFWSLNNNHGVGPNVVVNPGWLAPNTDFEIYIQSFDQAVFKGPRTVVTSDCYGQIMTAIPTLVEGDRILIKAQPAHARDYDVVLPCVPEFTGFVGAPGLAFVPTIVGPVVPLVGPAIAPLAVPVAGPVVGVGPAVGGPL